MQVIKHRQKSLDEEIERVVSVMKDVDPCSESYGVMASNLIKLTQARAERSKKEVDVNVMINATTSILGILLILKYEKLDIVTSKAISMVFRPRI